MTQTYRQYLENRAKMDSTYTQYLNDHRVNAWWREQTPRCKNCRRSILKTDYVCMNCGHINANNKVEKINMLHEAQAFIQPMLVEIRKQTTQNRPVRIRIAMTLRTEYSLTHRQIGDLMMSTKQTVSRLLRQGIQV